MRFTKMHGCGNDYVYVEENELVKTIIKKDTSHDGMQRDINEIALSDILNNKKNSEKISYLARKISDRKKGIGSDGLIIIAHSDIADIRMKMYNADGSVGKMCGNGIRCLCKYAFEHKLVIKTRFLVETDSGIKAVKLECMDGKVVSVAVNMGIPVINDKCELYIIDGIQYILNCVDMGNPHAVIFVDDVKLAKVERIGSFLEHNEAFPEGVNTEFVQVIDSDNVCMRVWERGSGETLACGTGACAAVVAGYTGGKCGSNAHVSMPGGSLDIDYDEVSGEVYMRGEAVEVYKGELIC